MKTIELVFFDAGGGHRSAANALCEVVRREQRPWDMRMMNLQELLDEMDVFRKITGLRLQDIYNLMLRRGWTLGSKELLVPMHGIIRLFHSRQVRVLERYWSVERNRTWWFLWCRISIARFFRRRSARCRAFRS